MTEPTQQQTVSETIAEMDRLVKFYRDNGITPIPCFCLLYTSPSPRDRS